MSVMCAWERRSSIRTNCGLNPIRTVTEWTVCDCQLLCILSDLSGSITLASKRRQCTCLAELICDCTEMSVSVWERDFCRATIKWFDVNDKKSCTQPF